MKILIIADKIDFRLNSLVSPLSRIAEIGQIGSYIYNDISNYNPDIIFSNKVYDFKCNYINIDNISYMKPFINLDTYKSPKIRNEYKSDLVLFGPMENMEEELFDLYRKGLTVKQFDYTSSNGPMYAGMVDIKECYDIYHNSDISIIPQSDTGYRVLDVIISDGKFVRYGPDFVNRCVNRSYENTKISKQEILDLHTNYDRLYSLFDSLNMIDLADIVRKIK